MTAFLRKFDWPLLIITASIISLGLLTIYGIGSLARDFFYRQLVFFILSVGIIFLVSRIDYRIFKNSSFIVVVFYIITFVFLFSVLQFSPIRAVRSWIVVHTFQFEPSEIAKLVLLILLAKYFSQKHAEIYRVRHVVASFIYTAIPAFLIFIQPDLGSAFIFFIIWFALLFVSGIKYQHLIAILILIILFASIGWVFVLEQYQKDRIASFLNPFLDPKGSGYSTIQSKIAIGSGSWLGNGLGKGTQSSAGFIPEVHTDFIFASFVEQFGFIGAMFLIFIILLLFFRISYICRRADNNFSKLFGIGFISLAGAHILLSIGINVGMLPVTGIPFSFLSYGGSHLLTLSVGIGIIESIKAHGSFS